MMDELFLTGIARHLAAHGTGVWDADGAYTGDQLGIVLQARPASPANIISLSAYGVDDDPSLSDSVVGLQVWVRRDGHDPRPVGRTAGEVFDLLHGAHDFRLPPLTNADEPGDGVWVVQCLRRSHVSGGQDENGRWADVQNFYATIHRPSTHRI